MLALLNFRRNQTSKRTTKYLTPDTRHVNSIRICTLNTIVKLKLIYLNYPNVAILDESKS